MKFLAELETQVRHHNAVSMKPVKNIVLSDSKFDQLCEEIAPMMLNPVPVAMNLSPIIISIAGSDVIVYPASHIEIEFFP